MPFGGGHPTLISATITELAILGIIVRIYVSLFRVWIILKKTGLDTSQTIPFRRGHPLLISTTIIDLAILGAAVENFYISLFRFGILLKKWVQIQVEPSKTEVKPPGFHQYCAFPAN